MGPETLYEFDFEGECPSCQKAYRVAGYVSEYPQGALNFEKINVTLAEPLGEIPVSDLPEQVVAEGKAKVKKILAGNQRERKT